VSDDSVTANVFLSFDNNKPGLVGIGTVCEEKTIRTSISQWFESDSGTAEVFLGYFKFK
jgi:hypothetical protein